MAFSFFDGDNTDAVSYGDIAALDALTTMSIACTIKPANLTTVGGIVCKYLASATAGWDLRLLTTGKLAFRIGNGTSSSVVISQATISLTTPTTIVVTYSGGTTDKVIFYINGVAYAALTIGVSIAGTTGVLTIGNTPAAGSTNAFPGDIEDVLIWNVVLTANEALSYHGGAIPDGASVKFFQPCHLSTQRDWITGAAATVTNTVNSVDGLRVVGRSRLQMGAARMATYLETKLVKIKNETEELVEGILKFLGLVQLVAETEELSEARNNQLGLAKVASETLQLEDGGAANVWDPAGKITETMSDGTVWTTIFPPFAKRTRWV
jgi:hypothetical protein